MSLDPQPLGPEWDTDPRISRFKGLAQAEFRFNPDGVKEAIEQFYARVERLGETIVVPPYYSGRYFRAKVSKRKTCPHCGEELQAGEYGLYFNGSWRKA